MNILKELLEGNEELILDGLTSSNQSRVLRMDLKQFIIFTALSGALVAGLRLFWAGSATPFRIILSVFISGLFALAGLLILNAFNEAAEKSQFKGIIAVALILSIVIFIL